MVEKTELETLEDIEDIDFVADSDDLREAAKEWIKHFDSDIPTKLPGGYTLDPSENIEFYLKLVFKHFFNLEEE